MYLTLVLYLVVSIEGLYGQCQPFISGNYSGLKNNSSGLVLSWAPPGCSPILPEDRIIWQKLISGRWVNLFESTAENQNGYSLDTEGSYNLHNRSVGEIQGFLHKITISSSTSCDSGTWNGHVVKDGKTVDSLLNGTLIINETPGSSDIIVTIPGATSLLAGRVLQFTCKVHSLRPKGIVSWKFDTSSENGIERGTELPCGGDVWTLDNSISKTFNNIGIVDVECLLDQDGNSIVSNTIRVNISAPPKLEEHISLVPEKPSANKSFTLSCTASGSNVVITWTKDTWNLDTETDYFEKPVVIYEDRADLDYGQFQVKISTLTSKPKNPATADSIREQSGLFKCEAKVLSEAVADDITILLGYRPIPEGDTVNITKAMTGEEVEFICAVISNPQAEFTWEYQGQMLVETTSKLNRIADKKTGGLYTCFAVNSIGHTSLYFYLEIDNSCKSIRVGEVVGIVLGVLIAVTLPVIVGIVFYRKRSATDTANKDITYSHNVVYESDYENQDNHLSSSTTNTSTNEGNADTPTNYEELSRVALYNNGHINVYDAIHANKEDQ